MKNMIKVVVMMLVLLIGLFVSTVSADVVKFRVNENTGEVWLEQPPIGRLITSTEQEALDNPGKEVPTSLSKASFRHQGFWLIEKVRSYSEVVVCTDNNKLVWKAKEGEVVSWRILAYYKILLIVEIILMGLFNFYHWKRRKYSEQIFLLAAILAILAAILAATVTAVAAAILATILAILATVVAIVAIVAIVEYEETIPSTTVGTKRNITYWGCVAIFYLLAIVALFI